MSRLTRFTTGLLAFAMMSVFGVTAHAQVNSTTGSGSMPCENGGWNWQADQAPVTTTVTGTAAFNLPANGGCLVQIPVNIFAPTTVHEVHGNMSVVTFNTFTGSSSCANGSIIAQLRDQAGNAIAAVKLGVLGPNSSNVPISATFATPLSVTSLQLQYFVDLCGPQTIALSLVMN